MKKVGRCEEIRNIYLGLFTSFLSFDAILIIVYLLKIQKMQQKIIEIIYFVLIGVFFILLILCFIPAFYIQCQPKVILIIDEQNKNVIINYKKSQRTLSISEIENIQIKQGFMFLNHLMSSTILLYMKGQPNPFKVRFAYPPLMIKNDILKLKEKV